MGRLLYFEKALRKDLPKAAAAFKQLEKVSQGERAVEACILMLYKNTISFNSQTLIR